ncbi:hypothetical protein YC2023_115774 [Brassica napus]
MVWLLLPPGEALPHRFFSPLVKCSSFCCPLRLPFSFLGPFSGGVAFRTRVLTLQSSVNYVSLQVDLLSLEFDLRGEMLTVAIQGSAFWISLHGGFVGALSYPLLDVTIVLVLVLAFSLEGV